jgi:hypothetical protein
MFFSKDVNKPEDALGLKKSSWLTVETGLLMIGHFGDNGTKKQGLAATGRPNCLVLDGNCTILSRGLYFASNNAGFP